MRFLPDIGGVPGSLGLGCRHKSIAGQGDCHLRNALAFNEVWPPLFLGAVNFYRRFIKVAASILKPPTDATKGKERKTAKLGWSQDMAATFEKAKEALAGAALLTHLQEEAEISVAVNASDHHLGSVIQQLVASRGWQPLEFFSQKLCSCSEQLLCF